MDRADGRGGREPKADSRSTVPAATVYPVCFSDSAKAPSACELRQQMLVNRLDAQDKAEALPTPQQKEQYDKLATAPVDDDDY